MTPRPHNIGFLALMGLSIVVGWHSLFKTLALSWQNDEYLYIALILPVSAMLIFADRHHWQASSYWNVRTGCSLLLTAIAVGYSGRLWSAAITGDIELSISMFALVLSWVGIFVFCFGIKAFQSLMFPLLFLFGLVPIPHLAQDLIIGLLQNGSAFSAHALFAAFGTPVLHDGTQLTIPGLTLQVAPECSSIRSSSILMVTATVMAEALLCATWRKALVIGFAIPLCAFKNGLRVFTIAMFGTRVDPGYLTGRLHHEGGILFFAVAVIIIFLLIWFLRIGEPKIRSELFANSAASSGPVSSV